MTKRYRNTQSDGRSFSTETIEGVWQKSVDDMDNHPFISVACKFFSTEFKQGTYCLDSYGHIISKDEYGKKSKHGWEIDHIHPVENKETYKAGASSIDEINNLRVLHWESNKQKKDLDARIYELEYEWVILKKTA